MKNLIIGISLVFIAIIAVSYFYFSNLDERVAEQPPETTTDALAAEEVEPSAAPTSNGALWTFALNGGAISHPSVHLYSDSTRFILVQDAYHILHAISPDGHKLWNAQLPGPIVDSISQLPDHSLVFTTAERLYRVDTEGDPLPGFSLKLPQRAIQGAVASGQTADDPAPVRIQVGTGRQDLTYDGRGNLLQRQARNHGARTSDVDQQADSIRNDLPPDCGPLAYVGPLQNDDQRYLLCGDRDGKLHCFRY